MSIPIISTVQKKINRDGHVSGTDELGGFSFDLDFSIPVIATAIHAGHHVREEILALMEILPAQRLFEEDPATDLMIKGLSNTVWGLDSRAVYDLNRSPDLALPLTPEQFWGVQVYHTPPTAVMHRKSLAQHARFYDFMGTVVAHMLEKFNVCIVLDIHSYNISRQQEKGIASPPVFNLGTERLDRDRWKLHIEKWLDALKGIVLPGIATTVAENVVFFGKGELCRRLTDWDDRVLVLPTEVSKVYIDELTGEIFPPMVEALNQEFQRILSAPLF